MDWFPHKAVPGARVVPAHQLCFLNGVADRRAAFRKWSVCGSELTFLRCNRLRPLTNADALLSSPRGQCGGVRYAAVGPRWSKPNHRRSRAYGLVQRERQRNLAARIVTTGKSMTGGERSGTRTGWSQPQLLA